MGGEKMESASVILAVFMMIPLGMMMLVFSGKSRVVLGFLLAGIFMAMFAGQIDGFILSATNISVKLAVENVTPITEEVLKAIPIVCLAFLFKPDRQCLIECAVAVGIGFSLLENVYLFSEAGQVTLLWALVRGCGSGMMHAICTLMIGDAMSAVVQKRKLFLTGSLAALSISIIYHSIYNIIVQSEYSLFGILLPIATYIPLLMFIKSRKETANESANHTKERRKTK